MELTHQSLISTLQPHPQQSQLFLFTTIQNKQPDNATPSYIDDVACLVVGRSEEENCRKLEAVARTAYEWEDNNAVAFDDLKTELIHFHQKRHSPQCLVTLPNGIRDNHPPKIRFLKFLNNPTTN